MTGQMLFKVIAGGREYVIYDDGKVEGFGDDPIVINRFPVLATEVCLRYRNAQLKESQSHALERNMEPHQIA